LEKTQECKLNVIITLAGKSLRFAREGFKKDKFLLSTGKNSIVLDHVVQMFNPNDSFHFIISNKQSKKKGLKNIILKTVQKGKIYIVDDHNKGPVYSVLKLKGLDEKEPVIISYCDFFVKWDYQRFLRNIYAIDGSIPVFRGFHPSSFTGTLYAYVKSNKKNNFISIREKKSYTKNPNKEYASCGIYYFKSLEIFKFFAKKLLKTSSKEAYVSLIFNLMKKSNLKLNIFEVEKFICLGTPLDFRIYLYWKKFFEQNFRFTSKIVFPGANLIPMSGEGKRFKEYGYRVTKPLIEINKKPMLINACITFPKTKNWNFVINKNHNRNNRIGKMINQISDQSNIITVNKITEGPAASCFLAKKFIDKNEPLFISSCDYLTIFNEKKFHKLIQNKEIDGIVWTYKLNNLIVKSFNNFGYCIVDRNHVLKKIIEKKIISDKPYNDQMLLGSFWFKKAEYFFNNFVDAVKSKNLINSEYYVGNNINLLLKKKMKFITFEIDQWISLNDPFELKVYEYWKKLFENK